MRLKITALLLAVVLIVCSSLHAQEAAGGFRIGAILSLTGPAGVWGKYARMGAEMAVKEQNELGGVNGRPIILKVEDSRSNSAGAVSAFMKLMAADKPEVIFGDVWTQFVDPLIPLSTQRRITLITPTVVADTVGSGPFFLTMGHKPETVSKAVSRFFDLNPSVKSISIFCWENPWGAAYLSLWKREIERRGIEIKNEICTNDFGHDYRTDVTKVILRKPDAVLIAHQTERILKLFSEQKFHPLILTTSNVVEVIDNRTLPMELAEGVYFTNWSVSREFEERFEKQYKQKPILEVYNSYESIRSILQAVAANPSSVRDGFNNIHYEGVAGPVDFRNSAAGNNAAGVLVQVKSGEMQIRSQDLK